METKIFQAKVFEHIKQKLPRGVDFKKELAKVLNLSIDSIYKLQRGETTLLLQYVIILSKKFDFSIDSFIERSIPKVSFDVFSKSLTNGNDYVENLSHFYNEMQRRVSRNSAKWEVCSDGVPLFNLLGFRELSFFFCIKGIIARRDSWQVLKILLFR